MVLKATYEGKKCLLNADYIVDIWEENGKYIAYTLDNERAGYEIEKSELHKWLNDKEGEKE